MTIAKIWIRNETLIWVRRIILIIPIKWVPFIQSYNKTRCALSAFPSLSLQSVSTFYHLNCFVSSFSTRLLTRSLAHSLTGLGEHCRAFAVGIFKTGLCLVKIKYIILFLLVMILLLSFGIVKLVLFFNLIQQKRVAPTPSSTYSLLTHSPCARITSYKF